MRYQLRLATSPRHRRRQAIAIGLTLGTLLAFGMDAWRGPLQQSRFWVIFLTSGLISGMLFHRFLIRRGGFVAVWLDLDSQSLRLTTHRGQQLWEIPCQALQVQRPAVDPRESLLIQGAGVRFQLRSSHLVAFDGQAIDNPEEALTLLEHQLITRQQQSATALGLATHGGEQDLEDEAVAAGITPFIGSKKTLESALPRIEPQQLTGSSFGPATLTVSAVLGLVFLLQWRLGAVFGADSFNPTMLLAMGANSSPLVQGGEWQRLITGNFLHGDLRHLLFNGFALISFGRIIEARIGSARFLFVFLSACLGGAVASALFNDALISVGSSTGILGLVGAYGVIDWYFAKDRRSALRRQVIMLFLALGLPALLIPNADHFGHAGGLIVGLLVTAWVLSPIDVLPATLLDAARRSPEVRQAVEAWLPQGTLPDAAQRRRHDMRLRISKILAVALSALFLGVAVWTGLHFQPDGTRHEALALLSIPDLPPYFANNSAWIVAIDPEATAEELQRARQAMAWAEDTEHLSRDEIEEAPRVFAANLDTLATLLFRLGELDSALRVQRRAFAMEPDNVLATQLARFELARLERQGAYLEGFRSVPRVHLHHGSELGCSGTAASNLRDAAEADLRGVLIDWTDSDLTAAPERVSEASADSLTGPGIHASPDLQASPDIHIVLEQSGTPFALLHALPGPSAVRRLLCDLPVDLLACDVEARVGLAAMTPRAPETATGSTAEAAEESTAGTASCRLYRLDEEVLALPGPL